MRTQCTVSMCLYGLHADCACAWSKAAHVVDMIYVTFRHVSLFPFLTFLLSCLARTRTHPFDVFTCPSHTARLHHSCPAPFVTFALLLLLLYSAQWYMTCSVESSLYHHRCILAPMVRVCELGFRELCQRYGADVIFTEEVVAARLKGCRREVVSYTVGPLEAHDLCVDDSRRPQGVATHTEEVVEYVSYEPFKKQFKRSVALSLRRQGRTAPLILQLGVADAEIGAAAVRVCCEDVDGIDLNMGCPKQFSITNGFGAALMKRPDAAGAILAAIHAAVMSPDCLRRRGGKPLPLSLKTRLMDTAEATVDMLTTMLTRAGHSPEAPVVHAITLHARERDQRSGLAPHYDRAAAVVRQCRTLPLFQGVCFVLNGSILSRADGEAKCKQYGFDGSMLARSAMQNPTVFARDAPPSTATDPSVGVYMKVLGQSLRYAVYYHTLFQNFKYVLTRVVPDVPVLTPKMEAVQSQLRSYTDCFEFFDIPHEERAVLARHIPSMVLVSSVPEPCPSLSAPLGCAGSTPALSGVKRCRSESPPVSSAASLPLVHTAAKQ